ncbi:MAG TPA: hypothetical protein VMK12_06750 [Anaeromyxobacteraceae bacterium]|nr:hypothetical protein [Anaeromyxobacteraceae bacterium]
MLLGTLAGEGLFARPLLAFPPFAIAPLALLFGLLLPLFLVPDAPLLLLLLTADPLLPRPLLGLSTCALRRLGELPGFAVRLLTRLPLGAIHRDPGFLF